MKEIDYIWPDRMTLYREDYTNRKNYIEAYRELNQHYGYKVRVFGGWMFFESRDAFDTWKAQK